MTLEQLNNYLVPMLRVGMHSAQLASVFLIILLGPMSNIQSHLCSRFYRRQ